MYYSKPSTHPRTLEDRLAVLDLGSNTFHLLIVEKHDESPGFKELYRERQFIYIASEGLEQIPSGKIQDAVICLRNFKSRCDYFSVQNIRVIATEALRSAGNAEEVLEKFNEALGQEVEIIEGKREAELIFKGTSLLDFKFDKPAMIMDIGGGSVELIVFNEKQILFAHSYQAGISVLRNDIKISEPPKKMEIHDIHVKLAKMMEDFLAFAKSLDISYLVGSSGPFEIIESIQGDESRSKGNVYSRSLYQSIAREVLSKNAEERARIDGMPLQRASLSKEAFMLIEFIMSQIRGINTLVVSPFALKEGVIAEEFKLD